MNYQQIRKILSDTAYERTAGSPEELACAQYIRDYCSKLGLDAKLEPFEINTQNEIQTILKIDGREIPAKSYLGSANGELVTKICYLEDTSKPSLKKCKDKIVLLDKGVGKKTYLELCSYGALGFVTYSGDMQYPDSDIGFKEIRYDIGDNKRLFALNINIKDAQYIANKGTCSCELVVKQEVVKSTSYNVVVTIPGKTAEQIIVTAHYDSTHLSLGAYDNMTGCIALLYLAKTLRTKELERGVTLVWCGSEERGLVGSLAYCEKHINDLKNVRLNINLDMLGSIMGGFVAFSCANEQVTSLLEKFLKENNYCGTVNYAIRSSDSNSFVKYGVPAVSFARYAPSGAAKIHTRYDTCTVVSAKKISTDMKIVEKFTTKVANLPNLQEIATISEKISTDVSDYFGRNS